MDERYRSALGVINGDPARESVDAEEIGGAVAVEVGGDSNGLVCGRTSDSSAALAGRSSSSPTQAPKRNFFFMAPFMISNIISNRDKFLLDDIRRERNMKRSTGGRASRKQKHMNRTKAMSLKDEKPSGL